MVDCHFALNSAYKNRKKKGAFRRPFELVVMGRVELPT